MSRKRNVKMLARQRAANCYAHENLLVNFGAPNAAAVAKLMLELRVVYERVKGGEPLPHDIYTLGFLLNTAIVRAESIGQPLVEAFEDAGRALEECEALQARHGRCGFTGPGILQMNAAMDLYADLLGMSSARQMDDAKNEAWRRMVAAATKKTETA